MSLNRTQINKKCSKSKASKLSSDKIAPTIIRVSEYDVTPIAISVMAIIKKNTVIVWNIVINICSLNFMDF